MKNSCSSPASRSPRHGYMKDHQEDMRRLWPKWHMAGPEAARPASMLCQELREWEHRVKWDHGWGAGGDSGWAWQRWRLRA